MFGRGKPSGEHAGRKTAGPSENLAAKHSSLCCRSPTWARLLGMASDATPPGRHASAASGLDAHLLPSLALPTSPPTTTNHPTLFSLPTRWPEGARRCATWTCKRTTARNLHTCIQKKKRQVEHQMFGLRTRQSLGVRFGIEDRVGGSQKWFNASILNKAKLGLC